MINEQLLAFALNRTQMAVKIHRVCTAISCPYDMYAWHDVEVTSNLDRFILMRDHLPDERIIEYLTV